MASFISVKLLSESLTAMLLCPKGTTMKRKSEDSTDKSQLQE
jgi:hypothetical protein